MSLLNRTWILVRACMEAMPFQGRNLTTTARRAGRHVPMEYLEHRELMAADVPTVSDVSKTVHLNVAQASYTFKLSDFTAGFHDAGGDTLQQIVIESVPTDGQLSLDGSSSVTAGTIINAADISSLTYFYDPSKAYTGSDTFTWTGNNSSAPAPSNANFTLVIPDKAPTLTNISKTVESGTSPRFNTSDFTNSFKDADAGDTLFQVQIMSLPQHGKLTIIGGDTTNQVVTTGTFATVEPGDVISLGQLANLIYTPTPGYTGSDFFTFNSRDLEQFAANPANVLINVTAAPALVVTGGGQMITNHSTATNAGNFTDFGGMITTADSTLGTDTRTFLIANNGNTTINLTGGTGKFVQISGPQASDFKVITQPGVTSLPAGQSTTFVIQFAPAANNTRRATVTIPNSTGTPYTFAISGTGLITTSSFVSSQFVSVDQGTTVLGKGSDTSFAGDQLTVQYSGFILNYASNTSVPVGLSGTVFDSTTNEGGKPFSFVLGAGQVIPGWDAALTGMKVGETRVLMIPTAAAYGPTGNGAIPPNSSLEFTVTLLKITKPTIVVSGNGATIKSGDNTPSVADGTDFGTLAAKTVKSSAHTFTIASTNGAFVSGSQISVAGADPSDFTVTQIPGPGSSTTFTVTFKPTRAGVRTAIIHVKTGIASNPDYSFTVKGNSSAYTDIVPILGTSPTLPAVVTLKQTPTFSVPLTIQNIGTSALPAGATTDVHFFLKDTTTGTQTDFAQSPPALNVSGLGAGATKTFNIALKLPATLPADKYKLVAVINNKHGVAETLASNDTATGTQVFSVEPVTTNLSGQLVSSTLPASTTAGQSVSGNITVNVQNTGNQKMPTGQQVTLTVLATNLSTGANTTLTVSGPLSVSGLAGHSGTQFTVPVDNSPALSAGSYNYQVLLKPVQALAQSSTTDDVIAQTTSNTTLGLTVVQPDISATLGNSSLPTTLKAGSTTAEVGTLGVVITNTTGAALPADEMVKIAILAQPTAGGSAITLVPAGTEFPIASLGAGSNMTVNVGASFTGEHFTAGNYTLQAQVTLVPAVIESNITNNLATVNAANQTITLTATA